MRVGAKGNCAGGKKLAFAKLCIVHRESLGPIDSLNPDTELDCRERIGFRRRVSLSAGGTAIKRFDDDNYEARAEMYVTPLILGSESLKRSGGCGRNATRSRK